MNSNYLDGVALHIVVEQRDNPSGNSIPDTRFRVSATVDKQIVKSDWFRVKSFAVRDLKLKIVN